MEHAEDFLGITTTVARPENTYNNKYDLVELGKILDDDSFIDVAVIDQDLDPDFDCVGTDQDYSFQEINEQAKDTEYVGMMDNPPPRSPFDCQVYVDGFFHSSDTDEYQTGMCSTCLHIDTFGIICQNCGEQQGHDILFKNKELARAFRIQARGLALGQPDWAIGQRAAITQRVREEEIMFDETMDREHLQLARWARNHAHPYARHLWQNLPRYRFRQVINMLEDDTTTEGDSDNKSDTSEDTELDPFKYLHPVGCCTNCGHIDQWMENCSRCQQGRIKEGPFEYEDEVIEWRREWEQNNGRTAGTWLTITMMREEE